MSGRAKWNDFNNSSHDDEEVNEKRNLDHCRLYITNIPRALNEDGLKAAFEKYGTLIEVFMSKDPQKKYAIVRYEAASEAKLAVMKMNRTEPLNLCISIAYKPKKFDRKENRQTEAKYDHYEENRKDDNASVSSRGRNTRREELNNSGNFAEDGLPIENQVSIDAFDQSLHIEFENLKLEKLKLKEEQLECKHRILMIQKAGLIEKRQMAQSTSANRCILPDGRIVVRNVNDRLLEARDGDAGYAAGAGDSLKIPGLQREQSRACVQCGRPADAFCARCRLTPYCSERCQRRDWSERHKAVCHNLARLAASGDIVNNEEELPDTSGTASPRQAPSVIQTKRFPRRDEPKPERENKNSMSPERKAPMMSAPGYRLKTVEPQASSTSPKRNQETKRPPYRKPPKEEPEEDWGNPSKVLKQQQPFPPKKQNTEQHKPTPQPAPMTSPPVKTEQTIKQSPPKIEQQPSKRPTETLPKMKEMQQDAVPRTETVKVPQASTNGVVSAPAQVLVPKSYLIEELSIGDVALVSVESVASACHTKQRGHVCLSMHEKYEEDFQRLCDDFAIDCEADTDHKYRPKPGDMFSYLNPEDGGWYRARGLTNTIAALIDSCKVVTITPTDKCKKLPSKYTDIPEFCCLLDAKDIKVGSNLKCTLVSKSSDGFKVSLEDVEAGVALGEGFVKRWLPQVEYPVTTGTGIPEVCRPDVVNNSRVLVIDATAADRVLVRPADLESRKRYDAMLYDVACCEVKGPPLSEPPTKGQTLISEFTDGVRYRALCKRTNVKQNKYQLEYIEYGNIEVSKLETLYPCPKHMQMETMPTMASVVSLGLGTSSLTPGAVEYLETLKEVEMILTIPDGEMTAPSGSVVTLTLVRNKEVVNRKVQDLCTPEWKRIQERGGNVLETESLMYDELDYASLPANGCTLEILEDSLLPQGSVSGCEAGLKHAQHVFTKLTHQMGEYCRSELGREPYLPRPEELCIAQYPPNGEWYRAVLLEQLEGPGGEKARVLYVDYGYMVVLPIVLLRKMLPEFVRGLPAVASHMDIRDFPENPTAAMIERARRHMKISSGRGELKVTRCERQDENGLYTIDAPDLIKAMLTA